MDSREIKFTLRIFSGSGLLEAEDKVLLDAAKAVLGSAYAPYSKFKVAAAALLANGQTVTGTNQENASFPAGLCAEGATLSVAASLYPGIAVRKIAITAASGRHPVAQPIAPCGICRQKLAEWEDCYHCDIEIIMSGESGEVYIAGSAKDILPLHFSAEVL